MVNVLLSFQREKVISVAQSARRMGLVVLTFGNFSLRDEETGYICITPSGMDYDELKPEDIVVVNRDGAVIDGRRTPSVETPLHCAVYRHRNDVFGVCHTHSVFATAWACCNVPFPVIVAELAVLVGGRLDTAPYRPLGTPELAEAVVKTLGVKHAVLMANHGVVAWSHNSVEEAYWRIEIIEAYCRTLTVAVQLGKPLNTFTPGQLQDLLKIKQNLGFVDPRYGLKECELCNNDEWRPGVTCQIPARETMLGLDPEAEELVQAVTDQIVARLKND